MVCISAVRLLASISFCFPRPLAPLYSPRGKPPRPTPLQPSKKNKTKKNSLIPPPPPLPLHPAEPRHAHLHTHARLVPLGPAARRAPPFRRARDRAQDLGVAELEVGGAVRGGLGADLRGRAPELVPASAVQAQERERVGGGVEGHCGGGW